MRGREGWGALLACRWGMERAGREKVGRGGGRVSLRRGGGWLAALRGELGLGVWGLGAG